jgi:phosphoglucosamine mutase
VISINAEAHSFNRPSEPNEKNLSLLRSLVPKLNADIGLAHDGDGDRVVAVDEKGTMVPFDIQLALMIQAEMKKSKNKKIISTMEASLTIRNTVEKGNGSIIITPVGSTYVASKLETENAIFGGEPCGEYIYQNGVHVPDGPMAAAKLVEMFCENGKLSAQAKLFKTHNMARERFDCKEKYKSVDSIKEEIQIEGTRSEEDGIRIDEEDGWFLIRASGTEPIIRLTMEYKDKEKLEKRLDELTKIIKKKIKTVF